MSAYERVPNTEDDGCSSSEPGRRRDPAIILPHSCGNQWQVAVIICCLLLTTASTAAAIFAFNRQCQIEAPSNVAITPCGTSPTEARSRGCRFDVSSFCWLAEPCYDSELSDGFDKITSWEWFMDPNKTQSVSHSQIMTGEFTKIFANWDYHLHHCTTMWKKLHRAVLGQGKRAIDGYIGKMNHTTHCAQMLISGRNTPLDEINTYIELKYPDCGIV